MSRYEKIQLLILGGVSDAKLSFDKLVSFLKFMGFQERIKGGHHIFSKDGIEEIINIQSKNGKAKPYQVNQVRAIILRYKLGSIKNE